MFFSTSTMYALRALIFLAIHSSEDKKLGIKEISDELDIPFHFLGKILQQLGKRKLINSVKGPGGGFYLPAKSRNVPVIEIINLFEGKNVFIRCALGFEFCSEEHPCPLHFHFRDFQQSLQEALSRETIDHWSRDINEGRAYLRDSNFLYKKIGKLS